MLSPAAIGFLLALGNLPRHSCGPSRRSTAQSKGRSRYETALYRAAAQGHGATR